MSASALSPKSSNESLHSNASTFSFPDKLAPALAGPMVWKGNELDATRYIIELSDREVQDIRAAVIKVKSKFLAHSHRLYDRELISLVVSGTARSDIRQDTFDLGNAQLALRLSSISKELHQGTGVVVLRGLDAANFNDEEAVIAFAGVCSYVCPERATDSYANQTLSKSSLFFNQPDHSEVKLIGW